MGEHDEKTRRAWRSPRAQENSKRYRQSVKGKASARRGRQRTRALKAGTRKMVNEIKSRPCADCGGTFDPVCMDFDHRPEETKRANVGRLVSRGSLTAIKAEIAKCDIVCANCHRLRTYRRRNHGALVLTRQVRGYDPTAQLGLPLSGDASGDD